MGNYCGNVEKLFGKADEVASYTTFNQGSYGMHTGVKLLNGDCDIDFGIKLKMTMKTL
ncbi:hypothetical protein CLPUN_00260 [Clostridium puniceum]|uniref:Uncharacterized protein n=1 Tax=Clostridium puniceum TaxID=29367 RepID=A0A1S8TXW9_9CLOT|nr:hypothetical protein [Clostridium puniceum]OOM82606.1 hypothetical protein CLPUN_00260 [Clostridium puniceum]